MGIFSTNTDQELENAKNRFRQQIFQQNMSGLMESLYDDSFECFSNFDNFGDREKKCLAERSQRFINNFERVANVVNNKLS